MTQFAMLEEDVHRLPQRVIENLDHLLVHEWILRRGIERIRAFHAGKSERHGIRTCASCSAAQTSGSPSGGPNPITMSSG